jgi:hypothetical protein
MRDPMYMNTRSSYTPSRHITEDEFRKFNYYSVKSFYERDLGSTRFDVVKLTNVSKVAVDWDSFTPNHTSVVYEVVSCVEICIEGEPLLEELVLYDPPYSIVKKYFDEYNVTVI